MYTVIEGGVTAAAGFETASTAAGIKYKNRKDMAMIYSEKPCRAAGTFTTNIVKAAPVKWDQKIVKESEYAQAVVINAGIANACTGAEGMGYCAETAQAASAALNVPESAVLVASTGVIGMQLPMDKLKAGIKAMAPELSGTIESGMEAAKSIMTTDTKKKEVAVRRQDRNRRRHVQGLWHDPSEYVHHAFLCHHRHCHLQGASAGSPERRCKGYLQHDLCGWGYLH